MQHRSQLSLVRAYTAGYLFKYPQLKKYLNFSRRTQIFFNFYKRLQNLTQLEVFEKMVLQPVFQFEANNNIIDFYIMIEEKNTHLAEKLQEFEEQQILASSNSASRIMQKPYRKSKKDCLKQKKKVKDIEREIAKTSKNYTVKTMNKLKSDEDNSVTTQDQITLKIKDSSTGDCQKGNRLLSRLLLKPPYITITNSNVIVGNFGHASAVLKRPLLEGFYFLQVTVMPDAKRQKITNIKSSVRVGICPYDFNPSFPLGCEESICYKSVDGSFMSKGEKIGDDAIVSQSQSFTVGDVVGVLMRIAPPSKNPNPQEINQDSSVSFFKNGKLIYQHKKLKQQFYCFAVSLYNYSQVQIQEGPNSIFPMPAQARHYYQALNQKIPYKDLQNSRIFKI